MKFRTTRYMMLLTALLISMATFADDFTLKGKVVDEEEHALELVTVSCPAQGKVTMTNLKGEFTLHLQSADSIEVRFSMVGYATRKRVFRSPKKQLRVQIVMHPMKALKEVTVTQQRRQTGQTQQLDVKDLKQTPNTTGNAVEELIQQQAGVSTHNELSSQYNVRGGSFDENLVYINQVEVYRPMLVSSGQQEGLSIINPDMVEKIGFSTGGFEAKYGDKMSSALDITYRHVEGFEANVSASLISLISLIIRLISVTNPTNDGRWISSVISRTIIITSPLKTARQVSEQWQTSSRLRSTSTVRRRICFAPSSVLSASPVTSAIQQI